MRVDKLLPLLLIGRGMVLGVLVRNLKVSFLRRM